MLDLLEKTLELLLATVVITLSYSYDRDDAEGCGYRSVVLLLVPDIAPEDEEGKGDGIMGGGEGTGNGE